jgi:sigma54-dependent transcription regulator
LILADDPLIADTRNFVPRRDFSVCVADSRWQARSVLRQRDIASSLAQVDLMLSHYVRRVFTGAATARSGYFAGAQDSTLILDESGKLPLDLQVGQVGAKDLTGTACTGGKRRDCLR